MAKSSSIGPAQRLAGECGAHGGELDALLPARERMWQQIRECGNLHFQLLTKRPENMARFLPIDWERGYPNVWLGVSIESAGAPITCARHQPAFGSSPTNRRLAGYRRLVRQFPAI